MGAGDSSKEKEVQFAFGLTARNLLGRWGDYTETDRIAFEDGLEGSGVGGESWGAACG